MSLDIRQLGIFMSLLTNRMNKLITYIHNMIKRVFLSGLYIIFSGLLILPVVAQEVISKKGYQDPPEAIKKMILAPRHENVTLSNLSPDKAWFLNLKNDGIVTVERLGLPYINLAGVQIDTIANRARSLTTGSMAGLELIPATGGTPRPIPVPSGARITSPRWSPDGKRIAFFAHFKDATHIYVVTAATGRSVKITPRPVLATMNTSFEWSGNGKYILTILIPEKRAPKPKQYINDNHIRVRITNEGKTTIRTARHLLEDTWEENLFEYYTTGQITRITVDNPRQLKNVGKPGIYSSLSFSPDGNYLLVTTTQKPFSNIVPVRYFGTVNELWDIEGKVISMISKKELREGPAPATGTKLPGINPDTTGSPQDSIPKRLFRWRPDGNGISYLMQDPATPPSSSDSTNTPNDATHNNTNSVTSQKQQNQAKTTDRVPRKDKVYHWLPPYGEDDIKIIYENDNLIENLEYSEECEIIFITETSGGQTQLSAVNLDEPEKKYTIYKYKKSEFYTNPGSLMTKTSEKNGERVAFMSTDKRHIYLSGTQYYKDWQDKAPQSFVDRIEITTGEKNRVFESSPGLHERISTVFDHDFRKVIISREAPTVIADQYLKDMESGKEYQLTNNIDYMPDVTAANYQRIEIQRNDGIKFFADVWLPKDWNGEKLPAVFWFYPRNYDDQESFDKSKRSTNINSFRSTGIRSWKIFTTLGYAFIEPDFPIIGSPDRMNDFYVPDIRKNWAAILDALDEKGIIDRSRLGIGGHSYGAFSTANSMIHTPYFKAGIAGSGNYNRTLTPMTFQSEKRLLWDARETYLEMSPLLYADRLNGALLMYHGEDDNNEGTWLINSERMFMALNGLDKPAALYIYPYEDHTPAGLETQLDMWARWIDWFEFYVKEKGGKQ